MEKDSLEIQYHVYQLLSQQSNCVGSPASRVKKELKQSEHNPVMKYMT